MSHPGRKPKSERARHQLDRPVRVTLRDVAHQSGLSLGTVSRILNGGNKSVWASTASREASVRTLAARLGYKPNHIARSLRSQRTHTIALVYGIASPLLYGAYEAMAGAIVSVLNERGYHLLFIPLPPESMDAWPLDLLRNGRVDGCIVMDPLPQVVVDVLKEIGLPFVGVNVGCRVPCVRPNDEAGTRLAVDHLVGLGHRRIAFFAGEQSDEPFAVGVAPATDEPHFSLPLRAEAFARAMGRHGSAVAGGPDAESPAAFVARWRAASPTERSTAVLIYRGLVALQLQKELWTAGVAVPRDLSLVTFDDLPAMRWLTPPMTAVDVPVPQLGERAAILLINRLERGEVLPAEPVILPERLIVRGSTAPPPPHVAATRGRAVDRPPARRSSERKAQP